MACPSAPEKYAHASIGASLRACWMNASITEFLIINIARPVRADLTGTDRLFVIFEFGYRGRFAAYRTPRVTFDRYGAELHGKRVECEEAIGQELTRANGELERLGRLYRAEHSCDGAEYTSLAARWNSTLRRGLIEYAAIAGVARCIRHRLALETKYAAVRVWFFLKNTGVIDEKF